MNCERLLNMDEDARPKARCTQAPLMGVKLIISFPSKEQASFGTGFNPGLIVTWSGFVRSGAPEELRHDGKNSVHWISFITAQKKKKKLFLH